MSFDIIAQTLLAGLNLACFYLLMSLGLVIMFSICGIVNLAHGVFYMLGAYGVFYLLKGAGLNFFFSTAFVMLAIGLTGILFERFIFRTIGGEFTSTIVITIGFMIALESIGYLVFGTEARGLAAPIAGFFRLSGTKVAYYRLAIFPLTAFLVLCVYGILQKTKLGLAMRASEEDRIVAELQGINPNRVNAFVFFIGFALSAAAGCLMAPVYALSPSMGTQPLTKAFMVIILGGMGSLPGLLVGSTVLGLMDAFLAMTLGTQIAYVIAWVMVITILIFRPRGIFAGD